MVVLPISTSAKDVASILRNVLTELNYKFNRENVEKYYSQFMVILPIPRFAYAFRFNVLEPVEFTIDVYDAKITHTGEIHFIEIEDINEKIYRYAQKIITQMIERLPQKPWEFTFSQRLQCGFLIPEILFAKRKWNKVFRNIV